MGLTDDGTFSMSLNKMRAVFGLPPLPPAGRGPDGLLATPLTDAEKAELKRQFKAVYVGAKSPACVATGPWAEAEWHFDVFQVPKGESAATLPVTKPQAAAHQPDEPKPAAIRFREFL